MTANYVDVLVAGIEQGYEVADNSEPVDDDDLGLGGP
jgi:hypothetical protein